MESTAKRVSVVVSRLGLSCVSLVLLTTAGGCAQRTAGTAPDAIFYNGKIITVDSGFTIQEAFAVRGDAYVAVGTNAEVRALAGNNTRLVDLKSLAVMTWPRF